MSSHMRLGFVVGAFLGVLGMWLVYGYVDTFSSFIIGTVGYPLGMLMIVLVRLALAILYGMVAVVVITWVLDAIYPDEEAEESR